MDIPPLPEDMPIDEHAKVFDYGLVHCFEPPVGAAGYTLEIIVHKLERNLGIVIKGVRWLSARMLHVRSKQRTIPAIAQRRYGDLLQLVERNLHTFPDSGISKETLLSMIRFAAYFRNGAGYVVDEGDKHDILTRRLLVYRGEIERYKGLVPKVFFQQRLGSMAALPGTLIAAYQQEYCELLQRQGIRGRDMDHLCMNARQLSEIRQERSYAPHLREDMAVVALAYAVPARRVLIYTTDHDLKALRILTHQLAPEKEVVVRMFPSLRR